MVSGVAFYFMVYTVKTPRVTVCGVFGFIGTRGGGCRLYAYVARKTVFIGGYGACLYVDKCCY